jgi:putative oxygen-independent coproporphyrinogen III oxidase
MEDWQNGGFGLYLHWPFCQSKCPYCDFNSHVASHIDETRWARAFEAEIARTAQLTTGRHLQSVYFGGGTPSLMSPDLVGRILQKIREGWAMSNQCEITLEANPGSIDAGRFRGFHDAGVNRISMGMQAMNDADLRRLGRKHTVAEAQQAFDISQQIFSRVSFDLIYARQDQTLNEWQTELDQALKMAADHLSLYQLTVEDGTVFGDRFAKGQLRGLPGEDLSVAMYEATQEQCDAAGMPAYEVSNHARPEQESRHNMLYWQGGDYVGIGPGAHGRVTLAGQRTAIVCAKVPGAWLSAIETKGTGEIVTEVLTPDEIASEYLMMGMRLQTGVSRTRYRLLGGTERPEVLQDLENLGLLRVTQDSMQTTPQGRLVLNAILRQLLA